MDFNVKEFNDSESSGRVNPSCDEATNKTINNTPF